MTTHTGSLQNFFSSVTKTWHTIVEFVKRHRNVILPIVSIVLILLAGYLVIQLVAKTFQHEFSCLHVIDEGLQTEKLNISLCKGVNVQFGPYTIDIPHIPPFNIGSWYIDIPHI